MTTSYACATCGAEVWRQPSGVVGRVFCSRACTHAGVKGQPSVWKNVRGAAHGSWKGGRNVSGRGYVRLHRPDHPMADKRGYVLEHRLVVAELLGRPLLPTEHVHHRNLVTDDNRPENLVALLDADHASVHRAGERVRFPWSREGPVCGDCGTNERPHEAGGLCGRCYGRAAMRERRATGYIAPSRRKPPADHV